VSRTRLALLDSLRKWVGRTLPPRWTERHGWFFVWRRVVAHQLLRLAQRGHAAEFELVEIDDLEARQPSARVHEIFPATSEPFPLPRLHSRRRWLLHRVQPEVAVPAMRVIELEHGVVFGSDGTVGPDERTLVIDVPTVFPMSRANIANLSNEARARGGSAVPGVSVSLLQHSAANYSHWLLQGIPRLDLVRRVVDLSAVDHVLVNEGVLPVVHLALERLGVRPDAVMPVPKSTPMLVCERLLVATPITDRSGLPDWSQAFVRSLFPRDAPRVPDSIRLLVLRGPSDRRRLLNRDAVIDALEGRGFFTTEMEKWSPDEQAALFGAADVVVAEHGAALANVVYCRPGTRVIELLGVNTVNWVFAARSWSCGVEHEVLAGTEPTAPPSLWSWQVDADQVVDVARLIELVERAPFGDGA
jgi:capsular polysaccharide biosynthesis protein